MRASSLSHVGAAAATLAAEFDGRRAHQLDSVKAPCQIRRDADDDTCLPVAVDADNRDNPRSDAEFCLIGERFEILQSDSGYDSRKEFDAANVLHGLRAFRRGTNPARVSGAHHSTRVQASGSPR